MVELPRRRPGISNDKLLIIVIVILQEIILIQIK